MSDADEQHSSEAGSQAGSGDAPSPDGWQVLAKEQAARWMSMDPEEVARLALGQPQLVHYLKLGMEVFDAVTADERSDNKHLFDQYLLMNDKLIKGLLKRLEAENVSVEERAQIYALLRETREASGDKASEFVKVNERVSNKRMLATGLFIMVGIGVGVYFARGQVNPITLTR
ncbi:hypothetical protein QCD70_10175 [Agreia sp. PsM10]|uniref:hypothetical protein n=1 Tax=Agreia sp. PsM10 TaxID=3030533 RepID=UPI00263AAB18|nr:hypothetical protein [Agreia sp. PsM10]MDN4640609.1 hypothetical protein [Agreia sp. PsM10]